MRARDIEGETQAKSQLKISPRRSAPYKIILLAFRKRFCPEHSRRDKKFQGEFDRFIHRTPVNKNKNGSVRLFVKSCGLTCHNSPVGGLGELNKRDRKSDTAIGYINLK